MADAVATIGADASQFNKELAGVSAKLNHFATSELGALKSQLAGAFTVGAITAMAKATIDLGSNFADMAARTGMSAESVQKLDFAAKQSGTTFDAVSVGIKKMASQIVAARTGNIEALSSFQRLGVSLSDLQTLSPGEIFLKIADGVKNSTDQTQAMADAQVVLGRSAQDLRPLLLEGEKGIKALADQAQRAGIIMSDETVKGLDAMGDEMEKLKAQSAATFAPFLAGLGSILSKTLEINRAIPKMLGSISAGGEGAITEGAKILQDIVNGTATAKPKAKGEGGFVPVTAEEIKSDEDAKAKAQKEEERRAERIKKLKEEIHRMAQDELPRAEKLASLREDMQRASDQLVGTQDEEARLEIWKKIHGIRKDITAIEKADKADADKVMKAKEKAAELAAKDAADVAEIKSGKGISVSGPISDSLARIGGFVGGTGDPGLRVQEKQLAIAEKMEKHLEKIAARDKTSTVGDATSGTD